MKSLLPFVSDEIRLQYGNVNRNKDLRKTLRRVSSAFYKQNSSIKRKMVIPLSESNTNANDINDATTSATTTTATAALAGSQQPFTETSSQKSLFQQQQQSVFCDEKLSSCHLINEAAGNIKELPHGDQRCKNTWCPMCGKDEQFGYELVQSIMLNKKPTQEP